MEEKLMLTFIIGVAIGALTMLITMSLMAVAKNADQQMNLFISKE
jgi:uncharacterized membrane-anchored protein YhcB (DUF1043 family)